MTAIERCALSYRVLLEATSSEQHHWREWFAAHPEAWNVPFGTGQLETVGLVVHHIFIVEMRYAQRLLDEEPSGFEAFPQRSIDDVFELGDQARAHLVQFLTSAAESELDRILTFKTVTAGTVTASKHKIVSNVFLHGYRHWGQIATVLRQSGFTDQWPHDMLLNPVEM